MLFLVSLYYMTVSVARLCDFYVSDLQLLILIFFLYFLFNTKILNTKMICTSIGSHCLDKGDFRERDSFKTVTIKSKTFCS